MACGAALAAVAIIPFVELLAHSSDVSRAGVGPHFHAPLKYALGLLLYDYWGRPTHSGLAVFEFERAFYVGALPLMLTVTALVRRRDLNRLAFAGTALFTLLVIFGIPPVFQALTALPGFHELRNSRLAVLLVLSLALLAGWGLDDSLGSRLTRAQVRVVVVIAALLVVAPIAWVVGSHASAPR